MSLVNVRFRYLQTTVIFISKSHIYYLHFQGYAGATPYTRTCLKFYFDGRRCVQAEFYSRCAENTRMRNLFTTRAACEAKCGGALGY